MSSKGFSMDFSSFNKKFFTLVEKSMINEAEKGVLKGADLILDKAETQIPKVPRKIGDLRASREVDNIVSIRGKMSATLGYNIEYAARLHELPQSKSDRINWSLPGSGAKWLEKSILRNMDDAMKVIAKHIDKARV